MGSTSSNGLVRMHNPEKLLEIETIIRKAIADAQMKGIKIVAGGWGGLFRNAINNTWQLFPTRLCCCPMGAVIMEREATFGIRPMRVTAAKVLGISSDEVEDFIYGFDHPYSYREGPLIDLGRKLRTEMKVKVEGYAD